MLTKFRHQLQWSVQHSSKNLQSPCFLISWFYRLWVFLEKTCISINTITLPLTCFVVCSLPPLNTWTISLLLSPSLQVILVSGAVAIPILQQPLPSEAGTQMTFFQPVFSYWSSKLLAVVKWLARWTKTTIQYHLAAQTPALLSFTILLGCIVQSLLTQFSLQCVHFCCNPAP